MMQNKFQQISRFLILLAIFLIPFYFFRFSIFNIPSNIFEISVFFSLLATCYLLPATGRKPIWGSYLPYLLLILVFIYALMAPDKSEAFGIFKGWFLVPVTFYWVTINNFQRTDLRKLSIPFYFSLILISLWGFLQKIDLITLLFDQMGDTSFNQYLEQGRVFGPFESPNFLAMFLVPVFFLSLPILESFKDKFSRTVIVLSYILPIYIIFETSSRAGIISLIVATALLVFLKFITDQKISLNKSKLFIAGATTVIIIGFIIFNLFGLGLKRASDSGRVELYNYSIQIIKDNPIQGIGLGNFHNEITKLSEGHTSFVQYILPYALHPHNVYMAFWLNLGVLGITLFLIILAYILFFNVKNLKENYSKYAIAALLAIMIHGVFDTTYFKNDLSAIFWLIFAITVINKKNDK